EIFQPSRDLPSKRLVKPSSSASADPARAAVKTVSISFFIILVRRLRCASRRSSMGFWLSPGETEDHRVMIRLARVQDGGGELALVGRIREHLRFEAAGGTVRVLRPVFSGHGSVEEISTVELNAGLVGVDLHGAAGLRV